MESPPKLSYYQRTREKRLAYQKQYAEENIERYKTYQGLYYVMNKGKQSYKDAHNRSKRRCYMKKKKINEKEYLTKLKKKMLRELINTVEKIDPIVIVKKVKKPKVYKKKDFIMDW
jgi:hypothetical protein